MIDKIGTYRQFGLMVLAVFVLAACSYGQSAIPPTEGIEHLERSKAELDEDAKELANDYLDLLSELERVLADYSHYFSDTQHREFYAKQAYLKDLVTKLMKGKYLESVRELETDLKQVETALREQEQELKEENIKVYKVTKNLRREIDALNIMLRSEVGERLPDNDRFAPEIAVYLKQVEDEWVAKIDRFGDHFVFVPDSDFEATFDIEFHHDDTNLVIANVHKKGVSTVVTVPRLPDLPQPNRITIHTQESGMTSVVREYIDSITVPTSHTPIIINSRSGSIQVTTWDRDLVMVRAQAQVASRSRKEAASLAEQVALRVSPNDDGIEIDFAMPSIHKLNAAIDRCNLEVKVPEANPIRCTNSHGKIYIENTFGGAAIKSSYSEIALTDIEGPIDIINNMGQVKLSDVRGDIKIHTANAPVSLWDCSGTVDITNSYSSVELISCAGDVRIKNSGGVQVTDHEGSVTIANSDGHVRVQRLKGDVFVQNSFKPLVLRNIEGSAQVENRNGLIEVVEIDGSLRASNQFAPIMARRLGGTLEITNLHGHVDVTLGDEFKGPSSITSQFGVINVMLSDDTDLKLQASAVNGDIQSAWPITISTHGLTKEGLLALGDGNRSLKVAGTNSTINLLQER